MAYANIELQITGMTCTHCKRAVEQAIAKVQGVEYVEVDLQSGRAQVTGSVAISSLLAAIEAEGYDGSIIAPNENHG